MSFSESQRPRTPRALVGALVAVVVVLAVVVAVLLLRPGGEPATVPPPTPSSTPTESSAPPESDSVCGLPAGDQTVPTTAAPETTWTLTHRMAAPSADDVGPGVEENGIHSCFARNPAGALFAVANLNADSGNPKVNLRELVTARSFQDENYRKQIGDTAERGQPNGGIQFAAFRVLSYTPDQASVEIVYRYIEGPAAGALFSKIFNLRWHEGDWQLLADVPGVDTSTEVTSLDGYVEWSGT
ncbi:hypothetical protein GCM10027425_33570 [Alteromonas gracilis]